MFRETLFAGTILAGNLAAPSIGEPIIIDSFAGGGGASTGIEMALGRSPDYAINQEGGVMAVYVDDMKAAFGSMIMCHMWADSDAELLAMADRIGVQRKWIQGHQTLSFGKHRNASWVHFDTQSKRALAVRAGAIETARYGPVVHTSKLLAIARRDFDAQERAQAILDNITRLRGGEVACLMASLRLNEYLRLFAGIDEGLAGVLGRAFSPRTWMQACRARTCAGPVQSSGQCRRRNSAASMVLAMLRSIPTFSASTVTGLSQRFASIALVPCGGPCCEPSCDQSSD